MAKKSKRTARRKKSFLASRTFLVLAGGTLAVVAAAAAFYAFTGDDAPKRKLRQDPVVTTEMDVTVEVFDNGFEPNDLTVPRGARVTWDFNGDLPHNVTEDRGAFESPTQDGGEWSLTFEDPGTYYYYCTLHHSMQGTLVVAE